ncbi:MAG: hypothetical protein PHT69_13850 [Bacteroidales bacterium]|nr:hypothetical protein [Bacteroidales bacterium]
MRSIFLLFHFLLIMTSVYSQNNERIQQADSLIKLIDSFDELSIVVLKDNEFLDSSFINQPAGGYGFLYAYFKNNTLYKIREIYGIKDMEVIAVCDYYYWNDSLLFVRETENNGPDSSLDINERINYTISNPEFKGMYYFYYNLLIFKLIQGEQSIIPNEKFFDSQSKEGQLLETSEKNRTLALNKRED